MPERSLTPRSALAGILAPGRLGLETKNPGVVIEERTGLAVAAVILRKGRREALAATLAAAHGVALPDAPKRAAGSGLDLIWAGPDKWLAVAPEAAPGGIEASLRTVVGESAAIVDQSDGRFCLRLSGPHLRDALAKGIAVDLHESVFRPGDVAMTAAEQIAVHFWQVDDRPTYDMLVFRAYAESFCAWLVDAAAEYGIEVRATP